MARFTIDIEKRLVNEYWSNRYTSESPSLAAAVSAGQTIVTAERSFTSNQVTFTTLRVRSQGAGDDQFSIVPLNVLGQRVLALTTMLPLFNVVRVDIQATTGRPSRKYYRAVLGEGDIEFTGIAQAVLDLVQGAVNTALNAEQLVDVDGDDWIQAAAQTSVGMRQLRRGSRRRQTPIIPPE